MKSSLRVRDVMARDVVTLRPEMEINRAMHILLERRFSGAPVIDAAGGLVGVLSKRDCIKAALDASYYRDWGATVAEYMSRDVQTLEATLEIVAAASAFVASRFRRFPVLEEGHLVGQISRADVLHALAAQWH